MDEEIIELTAKELLYLFLQRDYRKEGYPWQETLNIIRTALIRRAVITRVN